MEFIEPPLDSIQGWTVGSENDDFRQNAGSGSEPGSEIAWLLRVRPTPILALALSLALRLPGSELGSDYAWR